MALAVAESIEAIQEYLGEDAESLLTYRAKVSQDLLHLPGPDFVDRIFAASDRPIPVLNSLQRLYGLELGRRWRWRHHLFWL
jgi:class I fructose-bisphosphate aldolase